jgi:hypothetical protein
MNCNTFIGLSGLRQFHICCKSKWQSIGLEACSVDESLKRKTCKICNKTWTVDKTSAHPCSQLNRYMLDATGIPSVSNPVGPDKAKMAIADANDMLLPGMVVFLHMQPSTSEEVTISDRGWIFRHPAIVAPDKACGGLTLYTVAGLDHAESPPVFQGMNNTEPLLSKAVLGVYTLAWRCSSAGVPHLDLLNQRGTVSSISLKLWCPEAKKFQLKSLPPLTAHYFSQCAHGTDANVLVTDIAPGFVYVYATRTAKPGEAIRWDYGGSTDREDDPDLKVVCTCNGAEVTVKLPATQSYHDMRRCPGRITHLRRGGGSDGEKRTVTTVSQKRPGA